jgi:hypothetical protein
MTFFYWYTYQGFIRQSEIESPAWSIDNDKGKKTVVLRSVLHPLPIVYSLLINWHNSSVFLKDEPMAIRVLAHFERMSKRGSFPQSWTYREANNISVLFILFFYWLLQTDFKAYHSRCCSHCKQTQQSGFCSAFCYELSLKSCVLKLPIKSFLNWYY